MDERFLRAEEIGIRLEIVNRLPIWEPHPVYRHQEEVDRIRASIERSVSSQATQNQACECVHAADVYINFPDGSLKRPDIAIFCREPAEEEKDEAITILPEAVIEVVSKGYEAKDIEIAPRFYLSQGVKDVVIFNPYTNEVMHVRPDGEKNLTSPVALFFECGCKCTV